MIQDDSDEFGITKDLCHDRYLAALVVIVILIDAERVNQQYSMPWYLAAD